jgi:hypothetical protein
MDIRTKEDWIASAKYVVPLLPEYMSSQSGAVDPEKVEAELSRLLEAEDWPALHVRFEQIWAWLPDSPGIHRHPFGRLCDLCSEYWVFAEAPTP